MRTMILLFMLCRIISAYSDESDEASDESDEVIGSNFLQESNVITHNAYHVRQSTIFTTLLDQTEIEVFLPVFYYSQPSLSTLLDNGVCGLELDIWPRESGDAYDKDDFPVYHVYRYDAQSTCDTLRECLEEISEWMKDNKNSGKQLCPINVQIEVKTSLSEYWSNEDLLEINEIIKDSFKGQLYTPKKHNAKPTDARWPGFDQSDGINNKNVFVSMEKDVIERLYPTAVLVGTNDDDPNSYENQFNAFAHCDDPSSSARYCVIFENNIEYNDYEYRGKYIFVKYVSRQFIQLPEYPLYHFNGDYFVQLPQSVTDDANYWISLLDLPFKIGSWVPYKLWNAWITLATFDGMGNNTNGIVDVEEVADIIYQMTARGTQEREFARAIMTQRDIWGLGINATLDGMYVNNPLVWLAMEQVLDAFAEGKDDSLVPRVDLESVISETCQAISDGYTYIKTDYPYQTDEPYNNGNVWQFTFQDIDCPSDSQSMLMVFVGLFLLVVILVIFIIKMQCKNKTKLYSAVKQIDIDEESIDGKQNL